MLPIKLKSSMEWLWLLFWLGLVISFALTLPGFSQSDTLNYIAIAKTMLATHNFLIPYVHGHPYTDKPPLLFWLFILGWKLFGVNHVWPQLLSALFATASLLVTRKLAAQLWPDDHRLKFLAPFILIGFIYWAWFSKQIRVDPILTFAVLTAFSALIAAAKGRPHAWWIYLISIGIGGFCKGPVILMFALIPGVLLPGWLPDFALSRRKWALLLTLTTALGIAITLAWAIPAAMVGGQHFAESIFYGQIAHRAHYHQDHFYYYLIRMPFWLLPWTLYLPFWQGLKKLSITHDLGIKLCLSLLVIDLVIFSFFGQKLPHYIYPLLPIAALLMARSISQVTRVANKHQWPLAVLVLVLGVLLLLLPFVLPQLNLKTQIRGYFISEINLFWPIALILMGLLLFFYRSKSQYQQIILIVLSVCLIDVFMNSVILTQFQRHMHGPPFLAHIKTLEKQGRPIGVYGTVTNTTIKKYLQMHPHTSLSATTITAWLTQHPQGWVVTTKNCLVLRLKGKAKPQAWYYEDRFKIMSLWQTSQLNTLPNKILMCE